MKIVSACLAGIKCRWDGTSKPNKLIIELIEKGRAIPLCPEQLGGLPTPRLAAEQKGNRVFAENGTDVTDKFLKGANEGLKIAKIVNCKEAILKSKSPSCGCGEIYDGTFTNKLIKGDGIFTRVLKQNGIKVVSDEEL